jgi:hypothetical protein
MRGRWSTEKLRNRIVSLLAYDVDLEYDHDLSRRPETASEEALMLVACGFDLLMRITEPDAFPSLSRLNRRRGSRLIRSDITFGGGNAAIFLTIALSELLSRTGPNLDSANGTDEQQASADYRAFGATVSDFFSLRKRRILLDTDQLVTRHLGEFEMLEHGRPQHAVETGEARPSRFAAKLMAGEDPSSDPALVEEQRLYARDYYVNGATRQAIELSLDAGRPGSRFPAIGGGILDLSKVDPETSRVRAQRKRLLDAWREGAASYLEYTTTAGEPRRVGSRPPASDGEQSSSETVA